MFFPWLDWGCAFLITSYQGYTGSTRFIAVDVDLDHLAEIVRPCLHSRATLPLPLAKRSPFGGTEGLCSTFLRRQCLHTSFVIIL